jgi:predicted lipoprotein
VAAFSAVIQKWNQLHWLRTYPLRELQKKEKSKFISEKITIG